MLYVLRTLYGLMLRRRGAAGFVLLALAVGLAMSAQPVAAASGTSTVSVTVASATTVSAAGCLTGIPNVTDFGTVLPGTSNVTSGVCEILFGSSNDTSMLRLYQTDLDGMLWLPVPLWRRSGTGR